MTRLQAGLLAALAASTTSIAAQCNSTVLASSKQLGSNDAIRATTSWDPDGGGPMPEQIVVGGDFTIVGDAQANHIAIFDPSTNQWAPLGAGFDQPVLALAALPTGDLIAAGDFQFSGGQPTGTVARWDGTSWLPFAGGVLGTVLDLEVTSTGTLLVAGCPTQAGGVPVGKIAAWDGATWSTFGSGFNALVRQVSQAPNGDVVAVGDFQATGGQQAQRIARWDGTSWSQVSTGLFGPDIYCLRHLSSGELVIGGRDLRWGNSSVSNSGIVMWDGATWSIPFGLAPQFDRSVHEILERPNGNVVLAGELPDLPGGASANVASWDGSSWTALGSTTLASSQSDNVTAIAATAAGGLVVAGEFMTIDGTPSGNVATLPASTSAWQALGDGLTGRIEAFAVDANGDLLIAGNIGTSSTGPAAQTSLGVARWDGATWRSPGSSPLPGTIADIVSSPNGDVWITGVFQGSQSGSFVSLQRWDGSAWTSAGANTAGAISTVLPLSNGDLVAGGRIFSPTRSEVAVFDGTSWNLIGQLNTNTNGGFFDALIAMPNGDIVIGGNFSNVDGVAAQNVARWDGTTWSPLGTGVNLSVQALLATHEGDVVAGGSFNLAGGTPANRVARWDGQQWQALGLGTNNRVRALAQLPNGDVVAGGQFQFAGMAATSGIARWNGSSWSEFANGTGQVIEGTNAFVTEMLFVDDRLAIAGEFSSIDTQNANGFALVGTTCQADVTSLGGGCIGSAGPNLLVAEARPWLGAAFETTASGMPTNSLAIAAYGGATASVPLVNLLPQGSAGCSLQTAPDFLLALVPAAGAASSVLTLPNTAALAGLALNHQVVALELSPAGGQFTAATSTNALSITLGAF